MEESYETFEEDVISQRVDSPPQRPSRHIRRPELYATRKLKEEMASVPLQIKAEPKILIREPSFSRSTSTSQPIHTQTATQPEVPWESVTLNRCLFIAITILVLTSGFQRLHEALHGHKVAPDEEEDKYGLIVRRSGALRHRTEPETTLWELMLSWLPDLDDDDEDDEDDEDGDVGIKKRKPKRRRLVKMLGSLRNRPLPEKLLKQRDEKSKGRQAKKLVHKPEDIEEMDASDDKGGHVKNVEPKKNTAEKGNKDI